MPTTTVSEQPTENKKNKIDLDERNLEAFLEGQAEMLEDDLFELDYQI